MKILKIKRSALVNISSCVIFVIAVAGISYKSSVLYQGLIRVPWEIDVLNLAQWTACVLLFQIHSTWTYMFCKLAWEEDLGCSLNKLVDKRGDVDLIPLLESINNKKGKDV